jgi:hypothetical protein
VDAQVGFVVRGLYQPTFDGRRPDARQDIAAALRVADRRSIDEDLQEEIVDIGIRSARRRQDRDLRGQGGAAADAVDLPQVRRSHDPQKHVFALCRFGRQVAGREIGALGGTAPHDHPFLVTRSLLNPQVSRTIGIPRRRGSALSPAAERRTPWSPCCPALPG